MKENSLPNGQTQIHLLSLVTRSSRGSGRRPEQWLVSLPNEGYHALPAASIPRY